MSVGCTTTHIGGMYVARGTDFVTSLSLTQAGSNDITGVLNFVELGSDGKISVGEVPITSGKRDGQQLVLTLNPGLLGIHFASLGRNVAGIIDGGTLRLQITSPSGDIVPLELHRSSPTEFNSYADQLRTKAQNIKLNSTLADRTREMRESVRVAQEWMPNAESHEQEIPRVKDYYRNIDDKMQSALTREHRTTDSVTRSQLSVAVSQGDVAGDQLDVGVDQVWDRLIDQGKALYSKLASYSASCDDEARRRIQKVGLAAQVLEGWQNACQEALSEWARFQPRFQSIVEERADLKSFEATERANRRTLVEEASRAQ